MAKPFRSGKVCTALTPAWMPKNGEITHCPAFQCVWAIYRDLEPAAEALPLLAVRLIGILEIPDRQALAVHVVASHLA